MTVTHPSNQPPYPTNLVPSPPSRTLWGETPCLCGHPRFVFSRADRDPFWEHRRVHSLSNRAARGGAAPSRPLPLKPRSKRGGQRRHVHSLSNRAAREEGSAVTSTSSQNAPQEREAAPPRRETLITHLGRRHRLSGERPRPVPNNRPSESPHPREKHRVEELPLTFAVKSHRLSRERSRSATNNRPPEIPIPSSREVASLSCTTTSPHSLFDTAGVGNYTRSNPCPAGRRIRLLTKSRAR